MEQLGVGQRSWIRLANAVEDFLLAARLIDWQIRGLLKLSNRTCSFCTSVDESNDLDVQLVNLLSPVGDIHLFSSQCNGTRSNVVRCKVFCTEPSCIDNDKRHIVVFRPAMRKVLMPSTLR